MESKKLVLLVILLISINFISAGCSEGQVDVNSASLTDLDKLYGIGPVKAQAIINARPFETLDDLIKVNGIGDATLNSIKEQGLACIEDDDCDDRDKEINTDNTEKENNTEEKEIIKVIIPPKEQENKVVKTNPKVINTENDTSKLIKGEYALIGLAFFSMLIIFLLVLKLRTGDKNEFD